MTDDESATGAEIGRRVNRSETVRKQTVPSISRMGVRFLHWPEEEALRSRLQHLQQPRLLLVAADATPPTTPDPLEDWVRLPSSDQDVAARAESLSLRARTSPAVNLDEPEVDEDGLLRTAAGWVALSDIEARLVATFLERFQLVVDRGSLLRAGWPDQEVSRNLLDVYLHKLRPRVESVGLQISTVRKRGYVLEFSDGPPGEAAPTGSRKPAVRPRRVHRR